MYHEEKMINGQLHWRSTPNGKWAPYTNNQLSERMLQLASDLKTMTDSRDNWKQIAGDYKERIDRQDALIMELMEALANARDELNGLPKSLGYEFDHISMIEGTITKAKQHMGISDEGL